MKTPYEPFDFPKSFFWGAAVSAHQVEGDNHNNWSVWELENAKSLATAAPHRLGHLAIWPDIKAVATSPDSYVSGRAIDHYHRYDLDFAIAQKLNMNAFRFSVEWSRIEPAEGVWSKEAIEHYRGYILAMKKRGLEPMMTLYHWTVPTWFSDRGGFERSSNIQYFVRFAEKVLDEFHHEVRYVTTINEPDTVMSHGYVMLEHPPQKHSYIKAIVVYRNLLRSHKLIYRIAHKKSRRLKVGFTKSYASVSAGDTRLITRIATRLDYWLRDDVVLGYVRRQVDFIGVNYYFSDRHIGFDIVNPSERPSDLGWDMQPQDLQRVLLRLKKWKRPLLITESGVADMHDKYRQWWITQTLVAIQMARKKGVHVIGYLHWSMFDNFEWAFGRWPRFGLVAIDYENDLKRTVRASGLWYGKLLKKIRGV